MLCTMIAVLVCLSAFPTEPEPEALPVVVLTPSEHVERLLNPGGRPLASGQRLDMAPERELSPRFDGEVARDEWSGALEINAAFTTDEGGRHGFPPRCVFCVARGDEPAQLLLAMVCEDPTRDLPPPEEAAPETPEAGMPPGTPGTPPAGPWVAADRLAVRIQATTSERAETAELVVTRSGLVAPKAIEVADAGVSELEGLGWAFEAALDLSALRPSTGRELRFVLVTYDGDKCRASWPLAADPDSPDSWGKLVLPDGE